jgi:hypothetical protein
LLEIYWPACEGGVVPGGLVSTDAERLVGRALELSGVERKHFRLVAALQYAHDSTGRLPDFIANFTARIRSIAASHKLAFDEAAISAGRLALKEEG